MSFTFHNIFIVEACYTYLHLIDHTYAITSDEEERKQKELSIEDWLSGLVLHPLSKAFQFGGRAALIILNSSVSDPSSPLNVTGF